MSEPTTFEDQQKEFWDDFIGFAADKLIENDFVCLNALLTSLHIAGYKNDDGSYTIPPEVAEKIKDENIFKEEMEVMRPSYILQAKLEFIETKDKFKDRTNELNALHITRN